MFEGFHQDCCDQIGNGVPVKLAEAIGRAVMESYWLAYHSNKSIKVAKQQHAQKYKAKIDQLDAKERQLLNRLKQLDERKESIAKVNGDLDATEEDLVKINAGGKVIALALTRSTFTQLKGTKLEALFSGHWDKKLTRDNDRRGFLDVNPVCFQAITILSTTKQHQKPKRNPATHFISVDPEHQANLSHVLEVFGLEDLHVTHALTKNRIVKDANHAKLLYDWLVEDSSNGDFVLLYHASRDGNEAVTFHSNCDDMGATLTIIKTTDGHIIEGIPLCGRYLYVNNGKGCCNEDTYDIFPSQISGLRFDIKEMEVFQVTRQSQNQAVPVAEKDGRNTVKSKELVNGKVTCFTHAINSALNQKWQALDELESELEILEARLADEKKKIQRCCCTQRLRHIHLYHLSNAQCICQEATVASSILGQQDDEVSTNLHPIKEWNTQDIVAWLNNVDGLDPSIVDSFEHDEINGRELLALEREDLKDFGITKKGTIAYILLEVKKLESTQNDKTIHIEHSPHCMENGEDHRLSST
ncbi:LOW QUALITY PROTEIN: hypothetical protein ACHAWO_004289 [Cyclotella atomus]|uniref:SAM domain-containing protein n=1 Tax=Cyclotella atomus TaxID=382360 RepID=A0ABD3Q760_9STRA